MFVDELRVSPMISTLDSDNGFKTDLLPMALSASEPAADGLRNAMMAVAAYHSADSESALPYKLRAIRFLSQTLSTGASDAWSLKTQLATSMMLCVHNVRQTRKHERTGLIYPRSLTKVRLIGWCIWLDLAAYCGC